MKEVAVWLRSLQHLAGSTVGIVLLAIGAGLVLNSVLKLYVLGLESDSYFNAEERCYEEVVKPYATKDEQPEFSSEAEKNDLLTACQERMKSAEKIQYTRYKEEQIVDGVVFLFIGGALWLVFRRK